MAKKKKKKQNKKKLISFRGMFLFFLVSVVSVLYLPAALLFFIGMLPTFVAYLTDKIAGKNKTFTIGALNFAGCFYYLIQILSNSQPMDVAMNYLSDPMTVIVIYTAAVIGYIINYLSTIAVGSILRQKSVIRLDKIEEKKRKLEEQWGEKVNGDRPLDHEGFPLENVEESVRED